MLYLSELLGTPVYDAAGRRVGSIAELATLPAVQARRVSLLLLSDGKDEPRRSVTWEQVESLEPHSVSLRITADRIPSAIPDESFLLLRNDLLDQQIIDVNGRKVVRVNDLLLEERLADSGLQLAISGVDIGLRGAVRRLLRGAIPRTWLRQLEGSVRENVIPWEFVDLIEDDPRRTVKLHISHKALSRLHPADLADIVEALSPKERQALFTVLDDVIAADALSEIRPKLRASILESLGVERAADIVEEMPPDAAADVLADLPEETTTELLQDMNHDEAAEIGELMEHAEHSAGGLMTTEYVAIPHTADALAASNLLRSLADLPDHFNTLFLIDEQGTLVGSVSLARLIIAPPTAPIVDLRSQPVVSVPQDAPERDVVELFDKYNLLSLAVVDEQQRLVGTVTVDDVISVLHKKG
jgi:CBS domain-containing protein/sporulation protein YlmC with PRC-barrel domain